MSQRLQRIKSLANNPRLTDSDNRQAIENLRRAVLALAEEVEKLERKPAGHLAPGARIVRNVQK